RSLEVGALLDEGSHGPRSARASAAHVSELDSSQSSLPELCRSAKISPVGLARHVTFAFCTSARNKPKVSRPPTQERPTEPFAAIGISTSRPAGTQVSACPYLANKAAQAATPRS